MPRTVLGVKDNEVKNRPRVERSQGKLPIEYDLWLESKRISSDLSV